MDRQFHEVANIFPMMTGDEFESLKQDIDENGQREPIWLHPDGRIIDGRNRYRACVELGKAPIFRTWDGRGSLVSFVVSLNLRRRHLTSSQRACVAVEMLPMLEQEARAKQAHGMTAPGKTLSQKIDEASGNNGKAAAQAAAAAGTNREYVSQAKGLKEKAPDLFKKVRNGESSITQAKREARAKERAAAEVARAEHAQTITPTAAPRYSLFVGMAQCMPFIDDATVDIVITSPPYNLGAETWPMGGDGRATRDGIAYQSHGDDLPQADYERWQVDVLRELYRVAKPGASLFYNHKVRTMDGRMVHPMHWLLDPNNPWTLRQEIIWDRKSTHNHSATLFWPIDERIYWMTKGTPTMRNPSIGRPTIWQEFGPTPGTWHPAPFTDKLPRMLLEAVGTDEATVVLDPFAGSCSTLRAAIDAGCWAIGVDISRTYLERAITENGWNNGSLY